MPDIVSATLILFCFIIVAILFCIAIIKLYITKIKAYQRKEIDFQKTLNTTIMETQEQVLNNISQDLHDDAGQQLTYINLQIENLKLDAPELTESLQPLTSSVASLSESIRDISHSLNNQLVMQQHLLKAIASETERLNKNRGTNFSCKISVNADTAFDPNEKIVIYRIFQEITNNILKHAKATEAKVTINTNPFVMVITDNGKGFDTENITTETQSLGLKNLYLRAGLIGYKITIDSAPGKGTTIRLSKNNTA